MIEEAPQVSSPRRCPSWCRAALRLLLARPAWSPSSANELTTAPVREGASAQALAQLPELDEDQH